jgi:hypothetical protein
MEVFFYGQERSSVSKGSVKNKVTYLEVASGGRTIGSNARQRI